jgi:hypothetical protein
MTNRTVGVLALCCCLLGCGAANRAAQLRGQVRETLAEQARSRSSATERWRAAQGPDQYGPRLELAFELERSGTPLDPALASEIAATCAADARALETAEADGATLALGSRWARERLNDVRLARVLGCRAAAAVKSTALQLTCADDLAAAGSWRDALQRLEEAFRAGDDRTRCEVVRRIDRQSPSPGADVASFPAEVVRACRIEASRERAEPFTGPRLPEERAPEPVAEALVDGLQLSGRLGMGPLGANVTVDVGWSTSRVGFALSPLFSFRSTSAQVATTTYALGLEASVNLYFWERRARALTGYFRPEVSLSAVGTNPSSGASFQAGLSVGAEYLLDRNVGLTAELGLHALLLGTLGVELAAGGSFGVVLHQ